MKDEVPAEFRHVLARELPGWEADGVIGKDASQALIRRYELDLLAEPQRGWAASAFAILGAVAIGAGIVTFVAANWAAIDSAARFAIVFAATITAYGAAFWLRARGRRALTEAAFVAAALGFGGSIALGAQQFNFSLSPWHVYALWAAGLVPLALALRNLSVSTVALAAAVCAIAGFLRFAEYDHNLTAKAAAFVVVGLAFIGAALLFERELPDSEPAHAA
jgi:uncharacterized membrane protein